MAEKLLEFKFDGVPGEEKGASLVSVRGDQVVTTSLKVAEYFGKEHKEVLRAIKSMECSCDFRERNFALSEYVRKNGNIRSTYPMYYLTRDGFTLLAMGFTGKVALRFKEAYITAFNRMEEMLRRGEGTRYADRFFREQVDAFARHLEQSTKGNPRYQHYDCLWPTLWNVSMGFEDNVRNVFSQMTGAYLSGMNAAARLYEKEQELNDFKYRISNFVDEISRKL